MGKKAKPPITSFATLTIANSFAQFVCVNILLNSKFIAISANNESIKICLIVDFMQNF